MVKKKTAADLLVEQKMAKDKDQALRLIMAGEVYTVEEELIRTAGTLLPISTQLYVKEKSHPYVSRGGVKLAYALSAFDLDLTGEIVLDIGSSTGGFTDVALRGGASKVYALDVGTNQLAWKLRSDERVVVMEQTNFRYAQLADFQKGQPTFACTDVSFISLDLIFPPLQNILMDKGYLVALIKPQFEADADQVPDGGIVTDPAVYCSVLKKVIRSARKNHFYLKDLTLSPIKGGKGNREFLAYFVLCHEEQMSALGDEEQMIEKLLDQIK